MKKQIFVTALLLASAAVVPSAHAGMFEWVDDMFTFREDQKGRIAPRRTLPTKQVYVPAMDARDQQESQYYVQGDLITADYLHGSASKVMRPNTTAPSSHRPQPVAAHQAAQTAPVSNYQRIANRDRVNQAESYENKRIYIGEPGQATQNQAPSATGYQATRIGDPVEKGGYQSEGMQVASRPGDYDYRQPAPHKTQIGKASRPATSGPWEGVKRLEDYPSLADDKSMTRRNRQGVVTEYEVQGGDTLSGISDKPQIYGDWSLWPLIWDANRGTMKDPDMIRPKQRLGIPRGYSDATAKDARRQAYDKGKVIYLDDGK